MPEEYYDILPPDQICHNCQKPLGDHCKKCMACSEVHVCMNLG